MGKLDQKVAIVTGAGRGLGKAYAIGMAKEGAAIVVNDVNESANEVVKEIRASGREAIAVIATVGTKETAEKLVEAAIKEFGKLDILINNAGIHKVSPLLQIDEKQWDAIHKVHLRGSFLNTQAAVKYMVENGIKGRIINITSDAGIYGLEFVASYSAAKAGIIGLTLSNARELSRYGICVNAIAPGARTPSLNDLPKEVPEFKEKILREKVREREAQSTVQRIGEAEDVVPLVIFLASDESYYVTGQVIQAKGVASTM